MVPHQVVNHEVVTYTIKVSNLYDKPVNKVVVTDTIASIYNFLGATGQPVRNGKILTWTTKLNPKQSKTYSVRVRAMAKSASKVLFEDTHEDGMGGWQTSNVTGRPRANGNLSQIHPRHSAEQITGLHPR